MLFPVRITRFASKSFSLDSLVGYRSAASTLVSDTRANAGGDAGRETSITMCLAQIRHYQVPL